MPAIRYRILGITFGNDDWRNAAEQVGRAFEKLNSITTYYSCELPIDPGGSTHPMMVFGSSLLDFQDQIENEDEQIVIYYGGNALVESQRWLWHSELGNTSWTGVNKLDPEADFYHLVMNIRNDILIVFDCPLNVHRGLPAIQDVSAPRPNRNIQLISFAEDFSAKCVCCNAAGGCDHDPKTFLAVPKRLSDATHDLAKQLGQYSEKGATVQNLLADMTDTGTTARPAPYHRQVLGLPNRFVLNLPPTSSSVGKKATIPASNPTRAHEPERSQPRGQPGGPLPTRSTDIGGESPETGGSSGPGKSRTGAKKKRPMSALKKIFGPPEPKTNKQADTDSNLTFSTTQPKPATVDDASEPRDPTMSTDSVSETDTYATAVENEVSRTGSVTATESTQVQPSTMADEGDLREARHGTYVLPARSVRSQAASLHGGTYSDPSVASSVSGGVPVGRMHERYDSDNFPSSEEEEEEGAGAGRDKDSSEDG